MSSCSSKLTILLALVAWNLTIPVPGLPVEIKSSFRVKYVMEGTVYLEGGSNDGLAAGQNLAVRREGKNAAAEPTPSGTIGMIRITAVASSSAVCEILSASPSIEPGDLAFLSAQDMQILQGLLSKGNSGKYPQVVSFSEGDPLEEEMRQYIPRPPSPEINRAQGRVGFEYNSLRDNTGNRLGSTQLGLVLRADINRLGGSYWNFSGYWRGRLNSRTQGPQQESLTDLLNRTYHLHLSYNNPQSRWVAGVGRLYLPWAGSLSCFDGGYIGRRFGTHTTLGLFGGTNPDPTSWNYDPHRQTLGLFAAFEGGNYDSLRYSETLGVAVSRVNWKPDRQFAFVEDSLFFKRIFSVHHSMEADLLQATPQNSSGGVALARSFLTVRLEPRPGIEFDVSHNYFRDIPTFDTRLIATGLLDKLLFQGVSGGIRFNLPLGLTLSGSMGRSDRTGDTRPSWNQMLGLTMRRLGSTGIRADFRYSRFDSSFGRGSYTSLSFSRQLGERARLDLQLGRQGIDSALSRQTDARWLNVTYDWFVSRHYFLGAGFTVYRGNTQSYNQWFLNLGYRF